MFIPDIPESFETIAGVLPLRPFLLALSKVFDPAAGGGLDWGNLAVVAAWGVVAALAAIKLFRWSPRR